MISEMSFAQRRNAPMNAITNHMPTADLAPIGSQQMRAASRCAIAIGGRSAISVITTTSPQNTSMCPVPCL